MHRLAKGLFFKTLSNIAVVLFGLAMSVLLNRNYGKSDYGLLIMVFTVIAFLSALSDLGTKATLNRWLPLLLKEGKEEEASHLVLASFIIHLIGVVFFAFLMFSMSQYIIDYYGREDLAPLLNVGIIYLIGFAILDFAFMVLQSYQKWESESFLSVLYPGLYLLFTLAAIFLLDVGLGGVLYCNFGAAVIVSLGSLFLLRRRLRWEHWKRFGMVAFISQSYRVAKFGFPLLIITVNFWLLAWFDKLILGRYGGPEKLTIFYIAVAFSDGLMLLSKVMFTVLMPYVAELTDEHEIRRKYQLIFRLQLYLTITVSIFMVVLIEPIVFLLYGRPYQEAALAFKWLLIPFFIRTIWHTPGMFLQNVFGLVKKVNLANIGKVSLSIVLNLILIPLYGYPGAIAAMIVAYACYAVCVTCIIQETRWLTPFGSLYRSLLCLSILGLSYGLLHYMQWDYILVTLPVLLGLFAALLISFKEIGRGSPLPIQDLVASIGLDRVLPHLSQGKI